MVLYMSIIHPRKRVLILKSSYARAKLLTDQTGRDVGSSKVAKHRTDNNNAKAKASQTPTLALDKLKGGDNIRKWHQSQQVNWKLNQHQGNIRETRTRFFWRLIKKREMWCCDCWKSAINVTKSQSHTRLFVRHNKSEIYFPWCNSLLDKSDAAHEKKGCREAAKSEGKFGRTLAFEAFSSTWYTARARSRVNKAARKTSLCWWWIYKRLSGSYGRHPKFIVTNA